MSEFSFMNKVKKSDSFPGFSEDRGGLSPLLLDLEQLIGMEATLALVDLWGGVQLYIPVEIPEGHKIEEAIGSESAKHLARYFGGDHIAMPLAKEYRRRKRNSEIFRKKNEGATAHALAREYDMTQRNVWQIIQNERNRLEREDYNKMMRGG